MDFEKLKAYGIDPTEGIHRCMGDESFFAAILESFLEDETFSRAKDAFEKKDHKALFNTLHELKGVSGNASLKELFQAVSPVVEMLRNNSGTEIQIASGFSKIEAAYKKAIDGASCIHG